MADGYLKIDTGLDNRNIEKDLKDLEKVLKQSGKELEDSQRASIEKTISEYNKVSKEIEQNKQKQSELNQEKNNHKALLEDEKLLTDNLIEAKERLNEVQAIYNENMTVDNDKVVKRVEADIHDMNQALEETKQKADAINIEKVEKELEKSENKANKLAIAMDRVHINTLKHKDALEKVNVAQEKTNQSSGKSSKNIMRTAGMLLGVRSIFAGIQKAMRAYNSQTEQGVQNTARMNEMWLKLGSIIAPIINMAMSGLNAILDMLFKVLGVFGIFPKTAKKSADNLGGAVGQAKKLNKEMKQLAGFDEMNILSAQDTSSSGGGGSVGVDFDTSGASAFEKKFADIMKKVQADLKPFTDTIKNINWQPLIDSTKRLGSVVGDVFGVMYDSVIRTLNNAVAPFIELMAEDIVPSAINAIADAFEMLLPHLEFFLQEFVEPFLEWFFMDFAPVWLDLVIASFEALIPIVDEVLKGMREWWEFIKPVFEWLGDVAVKAIEGVSESIQELTGKVKNNEDGFGDLFKMIGVILGIYITFKTTTLVVATVLSGLTTVIGIVTKTFSALMVIVKAVAAFFAGAFSGSILAIIALVALLGAMILGLVTNFEQIKEDIKVIVQNLIGIFKGLVDFVAGVFTGDWKRAFKGLADAVTNAFAGVANTVKLPLNVIIDGVNAMIGGLNKIKIPDWVPGVGGKGINIRKIPRLAKGAYVTSATTAEIGEAGREAVIPLQNNTGWAKDFLDVLDSHGGGMGGEITIVSQLAVDGRTLAEVVNKVNEENQFRNNGRLAYG